MLSSVQEDPAMKDQKYCSRRDPQAEAMGYAINAEIPPSQRWGADTTYDRVLRTMRNQEILAATARTRSGY